MTKIAMTKIKITPSKPVYLNGFERKEKSKGIKDDLYATMLMMGSGNSLYAITTIDSINVSYVFSQKYKEEMSKKFGQSKDHFNLVATHTHSSVAYFPLSSSSGIYEMEEQKKLYNKLIELADNTYKELKEASTWTKTVNIKGLYGNRNLVNGPVDKSVNIFEFKDSFGKKFASLIQMNCHPTLLGASNYEVSADIVGAIRKKFIETTNQEVMIVNGATGDVSTRFYRENLGDSPLEKFANSFVKQINEHSETKPLKISIPRIAHFEFETKVDYKHDKWTQSEIRRLQAENNLTQQEKINLHRLKIKESIGLIKEKIVVYVMEFDSLALFFIPGEVTTKLGEKLKQITTKKIIICAYANNFVSYLVEEENFGKYFESYVSTTPKGTGEQIVNKITEAISQ